MTSCASYRDSENDFDAVSMDIQPLRVIGLIAHYPFIRFVSVDARRKKQILTSITALTPARQAGRLEIVETLR